MQLKKYEASTISEALRKIKTELGDEAVIFSSRSIEQKDGDAAGAVEVTAAVDRGCCDMDQVKAENSFISSESSIKNSSRAECFVNPFLSYSVENYAGGTLKKPPFAEAFYPHLRNLLFSGFNRDIASYLIGEANAEFIRAHNNKTAYNILLRKMSGHLPVKGAISVNPNRKKVVALVGPTGVGKTTTLAKIAARCSVLKNIKVKIVTTDTYRIAAVEQLKIYGKIMNIDVSVVLNPDELDREINMRDDVNLILIDTPGRNYRDKKQIIDLNRWLYKQKDVEMHLLLSATTSEEIFNNTVKCFDASRVGRILITKVDESVTMGHIYASMASLKIPVSYITTGQRVPEDILPASASVLSDMFLRGYSN